MKAPSSHPSLQMQPIIRYPKDAIPNKNYLLSIDLRPDCDLDKWPYRLEEYMLFIKPKVYPFFNIMPLGDSVIIVHRFGGTYGPAQFILTPNQENIDAEISITLVNGWGVPVDEIKLTGIRIAYETRIRFIEGTLITPKPRTIQEIPYEEKPKSIQQEEIQKGLIKKWAERFFPSKEKKLYRILDEINELELRFCAMSDRELTRQTARFKARNQAGETLDSILPEAYALIRETAKRLLKMRHYDTQVIAGIALHQGKIIEMKNGEGKTFAATLPAYLNALAGKGVHVVVANDYLAMRDNAWFRNLYQFLGLTVGTVVAGMSDEERKKAYSADITYGTHESFGFDYLRDNMKFETESIVQGGLNFAIIDEVDSILIDEARIPLSISGPAEKSSMLYHQVHRIIPRLSPKKDYIMDEDAGTVTLTEKGIAKAEILLKIDDLYDPENIEYLHSINQAIKAHATLKRDVDYVVKNGEIIIVDSLTGRLQPGRRFSNGLHQALEAKEGLKSESENQTLASITVQNYFRMYDKLSGMTGTAAGNAPEFKRIYGLDVISIPTYRPLIRVDHPDIIYRTKEEKYKAVIEEVQECHKRGQPVLVGTLTIDVTKLLSNELNRLGIPHKILSAEHYEKESEIISLAGQKGAVTISTRMAGWGTDIILGEGVKELGGLHIIGTERYESRRIDERLQNLSGRQGDPGSSRFYLSLEDELLRIFGSESISRFMAGIGIDDGQPIEHRMITKAIERAQARVEGIHLEARKHILEYDDVMNKQREAIYEQRRMVLESESVKAVFYEMIEEVLEDLISEYTSPRTYAEDWDLKGLKAELLKRFGISFNLDPSWLEYIKQDEFREDLHQAIIHRYESREKNMGSATMRHLEKMIMLSTIDTLWKDHLYAMDHLKEKTGMMGYGHKDPLMEYKREGFEMFQEMIWMIKLQTVSHIFMLQSVREEEEKERQRRLKVQQQLEAAKAAGGDSMVQKKKKEKKVGRNDPCPCGSGKKYKNCCSVREEEEREKERREIQKQLEAAKAAGGGYMVQKKKKRRMVGRNDPCPCGSGKKYKNCCSKD